MTVTVTRWKSGYDDHESDVTSWKSGCWPDVSNCKPDVGDCISGNGGCETDPLSCQLVFVNLIFSGLTLMNWEY